MGLKIERRYTKPGQGAYASVEFRKATSEIRNPDGSVVFRLADIDVPAQFSQVASDILAQKYFRKAGVPRALKRVEENDVPSFLWRSVADEEALAALPEDQRTAIVLCDVYGMDYNEVAAMTQAALGTVKSRIHRGRLRLRELLAEHRELFTR